MSRKYVIVNKKDLTGKENWDQVGDVTDVRESLKGDKCLFKFDKLPKDLPKSAECVEDIIDFLNSSEWTKTEVP
jgi:tRNA A58 N-methylase Trm61